MKNEIKALKKPEVYSYDELFFLKELLGHSSCQSASQPVSEKLQALLSAIQETKDQSAVFFMPKATFDIFSVFQGDNSICQFNVQDSQLLLKAVSSDSQQNKIAEHLASKLKILNDYLLEGNEIKPVTSQSSEFITIAE